jgi:hypothetical protein
VKEKARKRMDVPRFSGEEDDDGVNYGGQVGGGPGVTPEIMMAIIKATIERLSNLSNTVDVKYSDVVRGSKEDNEEAGSKEDNEEEEEDDEEEEEDDDAFIERL